MCFATVQAQTTTTTNNNSVYTTPPQAVEPVPVAASGTIVVMLIVSVVLGYTVFQIWKLSGGIPDDHRNCTAILERSSDHVNWTAVATNKYTWIEGAPRPIEIFRQTGVLDGTSFYRVKTIPD